MHIHPMVVTTCSLLMRNKQPATLSAEGEQIPTRALTPMLEAAQGHHGQGGAKDLSAWTSPCTLSPCPAPTPQPSCYWALDPAWGVGRRAAKA